MATIPLVRARYAHGFLTALREHGAPAERYLERSRLPVELVEDGNCLISAFMLWHFAGDAARDTGISDLGLAAGSVPVESHGEFGSRVTCAPTLYRAIGTFCSEARAEYSRADFYLTRALDVAWFCRGRIDGSPAQVQQVELYVLGLMLQTLRLALGMDWSPIRIRLQNTDLVGLADTELFRNAEVEFGCRCSGIAFPVPSLGLPLRTGFAAASNLTVPARPAGKLLEPDDLISTLRSLLDDYMRYAMPTLDVASEMAGTSKRSLQRLLNRQRLSFTRLVDEIRFEQATSLLTDPAMTITEIAFELGYSDPAQFTRVFRRHAGMPPRAFRRQSNP